MPTRPIVLTAALLTALPAAASVSPPGGLAPALRASAAEEAAFVLSAAGVHVYQCQAAPDGSFYRWVFMAPEATLSDGPRSVGTLTIPNFWESDSDRSSVAGFVRSTQSAGPTNLPWALFRARPTGDGLFAGVSSIQRVNTVGGAAPSDGCGPDNVGTEARVNFSADYYFYRPVGAG
jgi:hypothetical protein